MHDSPVVYVDMDNVLVDFDTAHIKFFGMSALDFHNCIYEEAHRHLSAVEAAKVAQDNFVYRIKSVPKFWEQLPDFGWTCSLMQDLAQVADTIKVLTSVALEDYERGSAQKLFWLQVRSINCPMICEPHMFNYNKNRFMTTKNRHVLGPRSILIDDNKHFIDDWNAHGGTGILFEPDKARAADGVQYINNIINFVKTIC